MMWELLKNATLYVENIVGKICTKSSIHDYLLCSVCVMCICAVLVLKKFIVVYTYMYSV